MQLNEQQTKKLLTGNYAFSTWNLSMLVTRLRRVYTDDPTETTLGTCANEMNAFVKKFAKIIGNDYVVIEQL